MLNATAFAPLLKKRRGLALALCGEVGVGKSHAAAVLLHELPCLTLSAHAAAPLEQTLQTLPQTGALPSWAKRPVERLNHSEPLEAQVIANLLAALLSGLAPVVLLLEDLHDAPEDQQRLIEGLATGVLRSKGVGLLVTSRHSVPEPFSAWTLKPLEPEPSRALVEAEIGTSLPNEAARWIYGRAAGNPLYTLEYLRFLVRQGVLWSDGTLWHWRRPENALMPVTVEALIQVQLAQVGAQHVDALQLRAMLPPAADDGADGGATDGHWARALGVTADALWEIQAALESDNVVRAGQFVHPLYREVVLKGQSRDARRRLSRRLIEVFADDPTFVASFLEDAELDKVRALSLLKHAAAQLEGGQVQVRGDLLAKAARCAEGEERALLALEAAQTLRVSDPEAAGAIAEYALTSARTASEALEILVSVKARNQAFDLNAWLERVPEAVRGTLDRPRLELTARFLNEDHPAVVALWEANPRLVERAAAPIAGSLSALGRQTEARKILSDRLERDLPQAEWCELMRLSALLEYREGHYREAEAIYRQLMPVAQIVLPVRTQTSLQLNRALVLRNLGRLPEAAAAMEEALTLRQELGEAMAYAFVQASLGELLTELGAYDRAEALLHEALATFRSYGRTRFLIMVEHNTGLLHAAKAGPLAATLATLHTATALRLAREAGETLLLTELLIEAALVRCQFGQLEEAFALASEGLERLPQAGNPPKYRVRALLALGLAQEKTAPEGSRSLISEALELASGFDSPAEMHKVGLELDRLNHDIESARERLEWFEAQGLYHWAAVARRYFPALIGRSEAPDPEETVPCLELLGPMRFSQDGISRPVRGAKRQELLALLAEAKLAGRAEVRALELTDALYPGEDERSAGQNLKTLIHDLRGGLGKATVHTTASGYALGQVTTDVETFLQTADTRLWRGPYLENVTLSEQETVREPLYQGLADAAKELLEVEPKEAHRLALLLLAQDPYDHEFLELALRSLQAVGNAKGLIRFYNEATVRFAEVGESPPPNWQVFLTQQ